MRLSPFSVVVVFAAGIVWVYMLLVWIVVCVQAYSLLTGLFQ